MLKPITKKAFLVTRPDNAIDMVLRAYHVAISGRPGPVVIQIPFDIQHTKIADTLPDPAPYMSARPPAPTRKVQRKRSNCLPRQSGR